MRLTDIERAERTALLQRWKAAIGRTPPERLAWLLTFAYDQDVKPLTASDRAKLRYALLLAVQDAMGGTWGVQGPAEGGISPEALRAGQQAIRNAAEALVSGRLYAPTVQSVRVVARLGPRDIPAPPTPRERFTLTRVFLAPLPEAAGIAAMELIGQIPPTSLRRCPYIVAPKGPESPKPGLPFGACGRVFVAVRRQKYCAAHRAAARAEAMRRAMERFREKEQREKARRRKRRAKRRTRR